MGVSNSHQSSRQSRQIDRQVVRWFWSFGYSNILKTCQDGGGLATTHTLILQNALFSWQISLRRLNDQACICDDNVEVINKI